MPDTTPMRERLETATKRAAIDHMFAVHERGMFEPACDIFDARVDAAYSDMAVKIVDAILSELEKPTPEMVKIGATALLTAGGYDVEKLDHYDYPPDVEETEAEFLAGFAAAIRAAKETK